MNFTNLHTKQFTPFGTALYGRSFSASKYSYGFGGQEKDDEIHGAGNSYTAEFWEYDSRLGRRWNLDPVIKEWESPYATFNDNPINLVDPDGADPDDPSNEGGEGAEPKNPIGFDSGKGTPENPVKLNEVEISAERSPTPLSPSDNSQQIASTPKENTKSDSPILSYQGEQVAKFTLGQTGKFKYNFGSPTRPLTTMNPVAGKTQFDCSAWEYYCMSQFYPELAKLTGTNTGSIITYAQQHGGIRSNNPKTGDLAIWIQHIEIITSGNGQAFNTSGASGESGAAIPSSKSFTGTSDRQLKNYGNGTFLGFWTPQLPRPKLQIKKSFD